MTFKIERKDEPGFGPGVVEYFIEHNGRRYGDVLVRRLFGQEESWIAGYERLGVDETDLLTSIKMFFPHAHGLTKPGQGVAKAYLEKIIDDSTAAGVKAVTCITAEKEMQDFLTHHGFENTGNFYFKIL